MARGQTYPASLFLFIRCWSLCWLVPVLLSSLIRLAPTLPLAIISQFPANMPLSVGVHEQGLDVLATAVVSWECIVNAWRRMRLLDERRSKIGRAEMHYSQHASEELFRQGSLPVRRSY
ncbi:hypothetical protein F5884DRAFT_37391 [Xylogone sp. PMI_703]|nr:hypothetical protein F5884DRAFT_37391 [Xylogone sp. PMI_703]